jgi:transcriptional regulator with XRE-family HTH domain
MTFSTWIKYQRKQLDITQDELAKKLCVSRNMIALWEKGTILPGRYARKQIEKHMNIGKDDLMKMVLNQK